MAVPRPGNGIGQGFLSFNSMPPRIHITAETDDFDPVIIEHWEEEGFDVTYLPFNGGGKAYERALAHLNDDLELGEKYALIAYGKAATVCLDVHTKPMHKLCALIAYYPTAVHNPNAKYPNGFEVLVHLCASQRFGIAVDSYTYQGVEPGFAEQDLEQYNQVAANLAWTRTLATIRRGFEIGDVGLERIWEEHLALEFMQKDAAATMKTMVKEPYVNHIPTLTGGIGYKELYRFYKDFFIHNNPASMNMRLISRTIGVDRVVDEMIMSFTHTSEIPWMLPGIPPTNKKVEVALVSVVCMRGKKLYHEHIYWDQASVLVQIGLLDPKLVPKEMKAKGVTRLPVAGAEAARKVEDPDSEPSNELIQDW